ELSELSDDPAIRDLVVEHDRVALTERLARAAEAAPQARDGDRAELRIAVGLVEYLQTLVHDLHVLRVTDLAIRVGRGAETAHARIRNAVEVELCRRHVRCGGLGFARPGQPGGAGRAWGR